MSDQIEIVVSELEGLEGFVPAGEVFTDESEREKVKNYLLDETEIARTERSGRAANWQRWRRQRAAKPKKDTVTYPWKGASNVVPPEALSVTNISFAQLKGKYSQLDPLWKVKVSQDKYKRHAAAVQQLLNYCAVNEDQMNLRKHNNTIMYDCVSLGTQVCQILWDVDQVKYKRGTEERVVVTHDGPAIRPLRLEDFYVRSYVTDTQNAPWYGIRTTYYRHELEKEAQNGYFIGEAVNEILGSPIKVIDDNKQDEDSMNGDSQDFSGEGQYEVYEYSLFWDVDKDGVSEDIRVWVEPSTGTVLREEYNELGFRNVIAFPFITSPYEFYANGVGFLTDQMQEELTTLHNMAINSGHLNSLQMFATRAGTDLADEELKPLKVLEMDSPQEDLKLLTFPDMTASARQLEETARQYIMRATGVNYAMAGLPDMVMKSRFSPSGYDQQATQGASFLELMTKNFDDAYGLLGKQLFYLLLAHKDRTISTILPKFEVDVQKVLNEVFSMAETDIREIFSFSVMITPMDETEDAQMQKSVMLSQMYMAYNQQMIATSAQLANPETPPMMKDALVRGAIGYTEMMQKQIEYMSDLDAQTMTMYIEDLKLMIKAMDLQKSGQVQQMEGQVNAMEQRGAGAVSGMQGQVGMEGAPGQSLGGAGEPSQPAQTGPAGEGSGASGGIEVLG